MKQMYKVTFSYKEESPCGGNTRYSGWKKEIIPIESEGEEELQSKISKFKSNNHCGYRKYIEVVDITKI